MRERLERAARRAAVRADEVLGDALARRAGRRASPTSRSRADLAADVRASLCEHLLSRWYPRAVDREHGGFLSDMDWRWRPVGAQERLIVTQSRHVWTASRAAMLFPDDTALLGASRHGFAFLRDVLWDRERGGFHQRVARDGRPVPDERGRFVRTTYGVTFCIFACARHWAVTRDAAALALARDAGDWLDEHARDAEHGGWFSFLEPDGTVLRDGYGPDTAKDQNAMIHVLEAFTELYRVWPDARLRRRLEESLVLIRDRMLTPRGYLGRCFRADWTPVTWHDLPADVRGPHRHYHDHVNFGHDVETAMLFVEACAALGRPDDEVTIRAAKRLIDHALRTGWDDVEGGLADAGAYVDGSPRVTIVMPSKCWWSQAETLYALLLFGDLFPDDPLDYHGKFLRQWRYVQRWLVDHVRGGWYDFGLDRSPSARRAFKAHQWKECYHEVRALINVVERLEMAGTPELLPRSVRA